MGLCTFGEGSDVSGLRLPEGARLLAGDTFWIPGLTNAGYISGLLIDTGPECESYEQVEIDTIAITHGHADHFSAAAEVRQTTGATVIAGRDDARLVENPEVNIRGMFSWARPGDLLVTKLFKGTPCPVDGLVELWEDPRARAIATPGHTLGHHAFLTRDGVLFTGDCLYQEKIWERHPLPYSIDPGMLEASLRHLETISFDWLVPGHGEASDRERALEDIEFHLRSLDRIECFIVDALASERTTEELIALVSADRGLSDNPAQYWLAVTTVKGFLGRLLDRGEVEFFVRDHAGWWKALS
jgi:glyoxylase-like metal-dependent hydrolase (beta-lactamase superfamily II)